MLRIRSSRGAFIGPMAARELWSGNQQGRREGPAKSVELAPISAPDSYEPKVAQKGRRTMFNRETTYDGLLGDLERLITALLANAGELQYMEGTRLRMEQVLNATRAVAQEQASLTAAKQDASRRILRLI